MPLVFLALAVLFLVGCGMPPPCIDSSCIPLPSLDEITPAAMVVHDFYDTQQPLPTLVVYARGDCSATFPASVLMPGAKGNVTVPGGKIMLPDRRCVYGAWYPDSNTIYMTVLDWQETLAHELLHQWMMERYGDLDGEHVREEWKTMLPAAVAIIKPLGEKR